MIPPVVGGEPPIGLEQPVDAGLGLISVGPRGEPHRKAVEGPFQAEGPGQLPAVHPENAEPPRVREHLSRPGFIDELRRHGDAGDPEPAADTVDHPGKLVPGHKTVGAREAAAHGYFVPAARGRQPSRLQVKKVQPLGTVLRKGKDHAVHGLPHSRNVQGQNAPGPRFRRGNSGQGGQGGFEGERRPLQLAENVGEPGRAVVSSLRLLQGDHEPPGHDHH
ncbi:hypothetical protein SDC9_131811 [bioreactor metagenome]|uniref:Uncharacterized protein n=1 Tax=bioreactor metagenome TaxID=1076179 RepID=A0A645D6B6_9ZZZZ